MVEIDGRFPCFMVEIDGLLHRLQVKLYAGSAQEVKHFASQQTFPAFSCKTSPLFMACFWENLKFSGLFGPAPFSGILKISVVFIRGYR
jgi:hypothetical protein